MFNHNHRHAIVTNMVEAFLTEGAIILLVLDCYLVSLQF